VVEVAPSTSIAPGWWLMPGMKRSRLTSLRLWQVEQAMPSDRAGSPKICGLSNSMSP
jgi:hypothetical protein